MSKITEPVMTDILEYLLDDMPEPVSPAERTRQWRAQMRAEGRPETKAIDAAISEAMSFLMSLAVTAPVMVDAAKLIRTATIVLVRDGYNRRHSNNMVIDRLRRRVRHYQIEAMPSRKLALKSPIAPPQNGSAWNARDVEFVRQLTGR